jgi:hypothetical protein
MIPNKLEEAYGKAELERRLLARRRFEVVRPELGPCWVWDGATTPQGYGLIKLAKCCKSPIRVHRLAASLWSDFERGSSLVICHLCHNPGCFRPDHLMTGTMRDNVRQMVTSGRSPDRKLTHTDTEQIRRSYSAGGVSYRVLAQQYGISQGMISHIIRGRRWNDNGRRTRAKPKASDISVESGPFRPRKPVGFLYSLPTRPRKAVYS